MVQRFLERGGPEVQAGVAEAIRGKALPLSLQMYGCRVVQKALEVGGWVGGWGHLGGWAPGWLGICLAGWVGGAGRVGAVVIPVPCQFAGVGRSGAGLPRGKEGAWECVGCMHAWLSASLPACRP